MTRILKSFFILSLFVLPLFMPLHVDAGRFDLIGSSVQYGSGTDQCPAGYELLELVDNPYQSIDSPEYGVGGIQVGGGTQVICQKMDLCDQYGNAWPRIGVDTEKDARFSFCDAQGAQQNTVTASLTASPTSVYIGASATLEWSSTNATSCAGTGFVTNGNTSGLASVSPSATTQYSVTCTGATGSAVANTEVGVTGAADLVPSRPSIHSGSLIGVEKEITFESLISNIGLGGIAGSIPVMFELDTGKDGTYDVTLPSSSLSGLGSGESKEIVSGKWISSLGTHAVRAVVDNGRAVSVQRNTKGCYETTGASGETLEVCPSKLPFVKSGCSLLDGSSLLSFGITSEAELCFGNLNGSTQTQKGEIVFQGTEKKDLFARYGSLIDQDLRINGGVTRGGASIYTGKKVGGGSATLDHVCKLIDPDSKVTGFKSRKYDSPGNNAIILWNGSSWEKHGAKNYNSHVSGTITCTKYPPEEPATVVPSGEHVEENESNNYSADFVFTVRASQCADGIDNDGDGVVDLDDEDCTDVDDNTERNGDDLDDGDGDGSGEDGALDPLVDIAASATLVREGAEVTISWTALNVLSCVIGGPSLSLEYFESQISGESEVEIEHRSTYVINCDSALGPVTDTVTVSIVPSFTEE